MYEKACVYGGVCRIAVYCFVPLLRRCVRGLGKGDRIVHFLHRALCLWGLMVHLDCAWKVHCDGSLCIGCMVWLCVGVYERSLMAFGDISNNKNNRYMMNKKSKVGRLSSMVVMSAFVSMVCSCTVVVM